MTATAVKPGLPAGVKDLFPVFQKQPGAYLDSAATTHKPEAVIEAIRKFYAEDYSTVRRGVYAQSGKTTQVYEGAREKIARLLGAAHTEEIVFTSGTTQSVNLVAYSYGLNNIQAGDEVVISGMEHHANLLPWQMVCEKTGAVLKVIPILDNGELDLEAYRSLLNSKTKLVAVNHVSNALGTVNPVKSIIESAHDAGAVVVVDGAQSVPHMSVNVEDLNADFYAFSGHKIYGPTGIGALYGKKELLEQMPPYQRGGDMIEEVTFEKTTFLPPPHRFEAGTPAIAQVIGLGAAIDFVNQLGLNNISEHEHQLAEYGRELLSSIPGLKIMGAASERCGILPFTLDGIHPHDIGTLLSEEGIAIRSGHHCAQPVMRRFGVTATARASIGVYNTREDLEALRDGLLKVKRIFA